MMKRIEVRNVADHGRALAEHSTEGVVSVVKRPDRDKVEFGHGSDGRTFCIIPNQFAILDITVNAPGDLIMVTVELK
jgi:hypothetical protein